LNRISEISLIGLPKLKRIAFEFLFEDCLDLNISCKIAARLNRKTSGDISKHTENNRGGREPLLTVQKIYNFL
jgi:hypothetical protein